VEHKDFTAESIADADILYMTRVQRERFTDLDEYERVKNVYILRNAMLEHTKPNLRILHPLPRVNEIAYDVDANEKAYYFQQAQNGLYAREAILSDVLGITLEEVKADSLKIEATEKVSGAVKNITDDLPEVINNFKDNVEKMVNSVKETFNK
jgi:aspartate carbamoyltransferase catalytic subunit